MDRQNDISGMTKSRPSATTITSDVANNNTTTTDGTSTDSKEVFLAPRWRKNTLFQQTQKPAALLPPSVQAKNRIIKKKKISNSKLNNNKTTCKMKRSWLKFFLQAFMVLCILIVVYIQVKLFGHRRQQQAATLFSGFLRSRGGQSSTATEPSTTTDDDEEEAENPIVIDIISIGSKTRLEYMEAQRETWGSHYSIRNFLQITEDDDDDPTCSETITLEKAGAISRWCKRRYLDNFKTGSWVTHRWTTLFAHQHWLQKVKGRDHAGGWLCAQKRFIFGLSKMLQKYYISSQKQQKSSAAEEGEDNYGGQQKSVAVEEEGTTVTVEEGEDGDESEDSSEKLEAKLEEPSLAFPDIDHFFWDYNNQQEQKSKAGREDEETKREETTDSSQQQANTMILPDYLILVDDDTFLNIGLIIDLELHDRTYDNEYGPDGSEEPYVAAGCRIYNPGDVYLAYGGFGTIFSKGSIKRLIQPIYCKQEEGGKNNTVMSTLDDDGDENESSSFSNATSTINADGAYMESVCNTISQNLIHERPHFQQGMNLIELFDARARFEKYVNKEKWTTGFCFHGDHYMAVMIEQYQLSQNPIMEALLDSTAEYYGRSNNAQQYMSGNCLNDNITHCDPRIATACHRQNPTSLQKLHTRLMKYRRNDFTTDKSVGSGTVSKSTTMEGYLSYFNQERQPSNEQRTNNNKRGSNSHYLPETTDKDVMLHEDQESLNEAFIRVQQLVREQQNQIEALSNALKQIQSVQRNDNKKKTFEDEIGAMHQLLVEGKRTHEFQGQNNEGDGRHPTSSIFNVTYQSRSSKDEKLIAMSPPDHALEAGSLQLDSEFLVIIGGYKSDYTSVSNEIQFFNIPSQKWLPERSIRLPPGVAQTHQGAAFDETHRFLYIVSGQVGGGCSPATNKAVRIHIDTGLVEDLPPLPEARYYPGLVVVPNPTDPFIIHLHAFGGASTCRIQTARNHWRLVLDGRPNADLEDSQWEELEPVLDGGTHGRAFQHEGSIYYTAFCDLDQTVFTGSESMADCQKHAVKKKLQLLHHTVDAGLTMVYRTEFAPSHHRKENEIIHWERLPDMPFPSCHTGMTATGGIESKVFFLGGGYQTIQTRQGSPPTPLRQMQMLDLDTNKWYSSPLVSVGKKTNLHNMAVWVDRNQIFGLRSKQTFVVGNLTLDGFTSGAIDSRRNDRLAYLKETRSMSVKSVTGCIKVVADIPLKTVFDEGYEDARATWNRANLHLQYPDIVAYPESAQQVSTIVKCARKTGYHICGRNGKHSFEGDTCTYGIVVDVSSIQEISLQEYDDGSVRLGAGLTLGKVALELANFGLDFPIGHCASVGLTGLLLVGGQGILSRHYGMTSDYVSAIDLVDGSGELIHATETNEYSDYLWLARGGGSGVQHFPGIITAVETKGLPKMNKQSDDKIYTKFDIVYDPTIGNAAKLISAWQTFYMDPTNIQDPLFTRLTVEPWLKLDPVDPNKPKGEYTKSLYLACYFYGDDELHKDFMDRYLQKLKDLLPTGKMSEIKRLESIQFRRRLAGVRNDKQLASGRHGWDLKSRWKGYSAVADDVVSEEAFRVLAESIFESKPYSRRYVEIKPLGGAIRNVDKTDTAFWHRDAMWWLLSSHFFSPNHSFSETNEIRKNSRYQHQMFIDEMGNSFSGMYSGYIDRSNSTGRDLEIYFGGNAERISDIKMARDPHNIFRLYRPISLENAPFNANEKYEVSTE